MRLKSGADGEEGSSGAFNNKVGIDAAYKEDIDFDGLRKEEYDSALARYREFAEKFGGSIPITEPAISIHCISIY